MDLGVSASQYVQDVRDGQYTCEEYAAATMERIAKLDGRLHAYVLVRDDAVAKAAEVDKKIARGEDPGQLCGMPVSLKDNICVAGQKATCCSRMLEGYVSPYDSTMAARLLGAGAVITGSTNMDEFAMGLTTEFSAYGPTLNPWDGQRVPGGSSGGSAAAVAARMCSASVGTDTGGSVRNPASFCSVVGYKPTYGLLSRFGIVSYANSIEQAGPMTRRVEDTALLLDVLAGRDENDDTTIGRDPHGYLGGIDAGIEGKKIGIISEMMGQGASQEVVSSTRRAISKLEGLGASCSEASIKAVDYSVAAYYTITAAEAASNLARFDNIRYGFDMPQRGYEYHAYISEARSRLGPEVTRRMIVGGFVPSAGHAGKYLLKALKVKSMLYREVNAAFESFDYLVGPTVPVQPFKIGEKIDDPVALFLVDYNTVMANLTGKPAISVPFEVSGGLPIGVQLMARSGCDRQLLQAAFALQEAAGLQEAPPL